MLFKNKIIISIEIMLFEKNILERSKENLYMRYAYYESSVKNTMLLLDYFDMLLITYPNEFNKLLIITTEEELSSLGDKFKKYNISKDTIDLKYLMRLVREMPYQGFCVMLDKQTFVDISKYNL